MRYYHSVIYHAAVGVVATMHCAAIIFIITGPALIRRKRFLFVHAVLASWAVLSWSMGWICPLTSIEKELRVMAGAPVYAEGFVEHYIAGAQINPTGQKLIGCLVLVVNAALYARRWRLRTAISVSSGRLPPERLLRRPVGLQDRSCPPA